MSADDAPVVMIYERVTRIEVEPELITAFEAGGWVREWQASRPFTEEDVEVAELREWVDGKRSWSDQHHGLPNEIELTARADEATIRLLIAKLDARAALDAVTAHRINPKPGDSGAAR